MLLRAARSPCWRPTLPAHPSFAGPSPWTRRNGTQLRIFTSGSPYRNQSTDRKDPAGKAAPVPPSPEAQSQLGNVPQKPEAESPPKKHMLSESAKANKEQRKADWAIMREMAKYLWPKVCCHSDLHMRYRRC